MAAALHEPKTPSPETHRPMSQDIFDESLTFADLGLREDILEGITASGFIHPTHIQAQLIPVALAGKDVLGQAKTGTGKTAAFGLPLLQMIDVDGGPQALVLGPTREIASQIGAELAELAKHTEIHCACVIGGESMQQQMRAMKRGAQIIVGTPGRVLDLYGRGELPMNKMKFAVLDEVDRMLDIGFRDDIRKILKAAPNDRQTIFVSATISDDIEKLSSQFMHEDRQRITTTTGSLTVSLVDQHYIAVEPWDKRTMLLYILRQENPDTTIVFCRTKATVHKLTKYLKDKGIDAREIHGDMAQNKRNRVMTAMRQDNIDVLVASDLAARGLDVEHITHVVNYDLPDDPEVYVHRIGRTARAGRKGIAWAFVTPEQGQLMTEIEKLTGVLMDKLEVPDFEPGPVPQDIREERDKADKAANKAPKDRNTAVDPDALSDEELAEKFPGGVVPKGKPRRTMGSRFKRRGR